MTVSLQESLREARLLLPAWVVYGHVAIYLLMAVVVTGVSAFLGVAIASWSPSRPDDSSWVRRAQSTFPARVVAGTNLLLLMAVTAGGALALGWPFSAGLRRGTSVAAGVLAFFTASLVSLALDRRVQGKAVSVGYWWQSVITAALCFRAPVIMTLLLAPLMPGKFDLLTSLVTVAVAALYAFFAAGGGLWVARVVGLAKTASPRLRAIVERASLALNVEARPAYEVRWCSANAIAFPLIGRLAFTDRALRELCDEELQAICVHELGHLSEPPLVLAARAWSMFLLFPVICIRPIVGSFGLAGCLAAFLTVVVTSLLIRRVARRMEERADKMAHVHETSQGLYARALEKLHQANLMPVVMPSGRTVHPHLYDRLLAAGVQPGYPRPAPSSRLRSSLGLAVSLLVTILSFGAWWYAPHFILRRDAGRATLQWATAIRRGSAYDAALLSGLAWDSYQRNDRESAVVFYRAASKLDNQSWDHCCNLATMLAAMGNCADAQLAVEAAAERFGRRGNLVARYEHRTQGERGPRISSPPYSVEPDEIVEARKAVERCRRK